MPCLASMDGNSSGFGVFSGPLENQDKSPQYTHSQEGAPPPYWAVLNKFSGSQNWPHQTVILPGKIE